LWSPRALLLFSRLHATPHAYPTELKPINIAPAYILHSSFETIAKQVSYFFFVFANACLYYRLNGAIPLRMHRDSLAIISIHP
jgi:hypothetical protein